MHDDYEPLTEYSKEDLDRIFEETLATAEAIHKKFTRLAEDSGYISMAISSVKPQLDRLYTKSLEDPSVYPIVASGIDFIEGLKNNLDLLNYETDDIKATFASTISATGTFGGSIEASSFLMDPDHESSDFQPPPHREARNYYSSKLNNLETTLANLYDQVWQIYYGTSSDPHRAALFMMRTLFDNFFALLAPDKEVRNSKYWEKKDGEKPNQIHRTERLSYAIEKNITDKSRHKLLENLSKQINILYKAANVAHDRGELNEEKASKTLLAMDDFLKVWLDSFE